MPYLRKSINFIVSHVTSIHYVSQYSMVAYRATLYSRYCGGLSQCMHPKPAVLFLLYSIAVLISQAHKCLQTMSHFIKKISENYSAETLLNDWTA